MNDEKLKTQLGGNIATYRKQLGMTQAGLAEKLNYSDKAVSKWERGESMPDVLTLVQLAELFGVTLDQLVADPEELPRDIGRVEQAMTKAVEKAMKRKANKRIILWLSSLLVWFVATFLFVLLSTLDIPRSWIAFIYAIPADAIVRLSLRSAWRDCRHNQWLVSAIVWGTLLSIYMTLLLFAGVNMWKLFLLGVLGQIAVFLAFRLKRPGKEENDG